MCYAKQYCDRTGAIWELDGSGTYTKPTFFGSWSRGMTMLELEMRYGPIKLLPERTSMFKKLAALILGIVTIFSLTSCTNGAFASLAKCIASVPTVAAHRGGDFYTESTTRNFAASAATGAHVWETDVHFTVDGYPVLLHDSNLAVFGAPTVNIASIDMAQAKSYTAKDGSTMMSLWDFAQQIKDTPGQYALIELKVPPTSMEWARIANRLKTLSDQKRIWLASFASTVTAQAKSYGYQTAQIDAATTIRSAAQVAALGNAYEVEYTRLTPTYAAQLKAAGVKVYAWTSDTSTSWQDNMADGVSPLTDSPEKFYYWHRNVYC